MIVLFTWGREFTSGLDKSAIREEVYVTDRNCESSLGVDDVDKLGITDIQASVGIVQGEKLVSVGGIQSYEHIKLDPTF